jgi:hypothetical protein
MPHTCKNRVLIFLIRLVIARLAPYPQPFPPQEKGRRAIHAGKKSLSRRGRDLGRGFMCKYENTLLTAMGRPYKTSA